MARPIIALLTDFGLQDHYVGAMKGVALGICPEAVLVDITHDVGPQDVLGGALELAAAYRYFPTGTIFLVVVDPGVGSNRRGIAVDAGDYRFVGPDNGVLSLALDSTPPRLVVELTNPRYMRETVSRTFEGRDRFAPAAAWLAAGAGIADLGTPLNGLFRLEGPQPRVTSEGLEGEVVRVDRFGNLVTNIDRQTFERTVKDSSRAMVHVRDRTLTGVVATYADVRRGALCALFGSADRLEIAMSQGSAARELGAERGAAVRVRRGA